MRKTYLVTGASGFLGHQLTQTLSRESDCDILQLCRSKPETESQSKWIPGSVTDQDLLQKLANPLDGIFHLAAIVKHSREDSEEVYRTNIEGTLNMVRLAAQRKCRLVYVSTSGVVGCFNKPDERADEESPFVEDRIRNWPYYHSKLLAEKEARELANQLSVELVIVRPPVMLGPGDPNGRSTQIVSRLLRRRMPVSLSGGYHFVDIRDVAKALFRAMSIEQVRPIYHLSGYQSSLKEFCDLVGDIAEVPAPRFRVNGTWLKPLHGLSSLIPDPVLLEMGSCYWGLSSKYAHHDLGYRPRSARSTLVDTVEDLRSRKIH